MRRESDIREGPRTGQGRRARDRLLSDEPMPISGETGRQHRLLFLADELRESALAVGTIEGFLVRALRLLENGERPEALVALMAEIDLEDGLQALDDSLGAVRNSIARLV